MFSNAVLLFLLGSAFLLASPSSNVGLVEDVSWSCSLQLLLQVDFLEFVHRMWSLVGGTCKRITPWKCCGLWLGCCQIVSTFSSCDSWCGKCCVHFLGIWCAILPWQCLVTTKCMFLREPFLTVSYCYSFKPALCESIYSKWFHCFRSLCLVFRRFFSVRKRRNDSWHSCFAAGSEPWNGNLCLKQVHTSWIMFVLYTRLFYGCVFAV